MKLLSVSHLSRYFGSIAALVSVTFAVEPGQVLGVVGQRGSGKSTLLQLLSGNCPPSGGEIYFDGKRVTLKSASQAQRLGIETVHQYPQLADNLDVLHNVFLGRELCRTGRLGVWPKDKEMIHATWDMLAAFDLPPDMISERASNLPDEQRRIVALARALCRPCRLLLLDDALAALSFERQQKMLDRIKALAAQNVTVIISSDDLKHIFAITDSILVLYQGRQTALRPTSETTQREIVELIVGSNRQEQVTPVVWAFESYHVAEQQAEELRRAQLELRHSLEEQDSLNRQLTQANTALMRRAMQLEISSQVAQQVISILDQDKLLGRVVDLIQARFGYYFVSIWSLSESRDYIMLGAGSGQVGERLKQQHLSIPIDARSIVAGVCKTGARRLVDDTLQTPDYMRVEDLPDTRSELALPFHIGQAVIGALDIESDQPKAFDAEDQLVLQTLADQIAIAIRNARLYEEAQRAEQQAALANQMKSRFLATMSHELRTPLNSIINFSAFVARGMFGPVNAEQISYLERVAAQGKHLLSIINDVLDLSKIEAGQMEFQWANISLATVCREALDAVAGLAQEKNLTLDNQAASDLPVIRADPIRLRQVLLNLLSNAVKFTPAGGRITLRAKRASAPPAQALALRIACAPCLLISVADTGVGIPANQLESIFEEFHQTEAGRREGGTGLGLTISRRLVAMHSGYLWAESEVGRGSTFYFILPLTSTTGLA